MGSQIAIHVENNKTKTGWKDRHNTCPIGNKIPKGRMRPANRQKDNSLVLSAEVLVMPDDLPNARADGKPNAFVLAPPA